MAVAERAGAAAWSRFAGRWPRSRGWAALAVFWLAVLGAAGGTTGVLAWLGPPESPPHAAAAPSPEMAAQRPDGAAAPGRVAATE
jgi:hypothetical protein